MMEPMTTTAVYHNETTDDKDGLKTSFMKMVSLTILSLVFVLGVLGNGVVIWVTGFKMKKTISTVWYLNLAVADFLVAAFLPLTITEIALDSRWPFGQFWCKLNHTVLIANMFASVYILVVISVDRCVCVVWPVWAQNHRSVRKASCVSLGVWVLALVFSSPYFIFQTIRPSLHDKDIIGCFQGDYPSTPAEKQLWNFQLGALVITRFLVGFVVPFTVIVSCYSVIIYRLRRNRSLAVQSGRPFKIITAVIVTFFLCWGPFQIMQPIMLVNLIRNNFSSIGLPVAVSLAVFNSCLNPLLYVFMGQDFKEAARKSILKVFEKAFAEELPQTSTSTDLGTTSQEIALSEALV